MKAEEQFRILRSQLASPGQILAAQGEISLDARALLSLMTRMAERIKMLETKIHGIETKGQDE